MFLTFTGLSGFKCSHRNLDICGECQTGIFRKKSDNRFLVHFTKLFWFRDWNTKKYDYFIACNFSLFLNVDGSATWYRVSDMPETLRGYICTETFHICLKVSTEGLWKSYTILCKKKKGNSRISSVRECSLKYIFIYLDANKIMTDEAQMIFFFHNWILWLHSI